MHMHEYLNKLCQMGFSDICPYILHLHHLFSSFAWELYMYLSVGTLYFLTKTELAVCLLSLCYLSQLSYNNFFFQQSNFKESIVRDDLPTKAQK